MMTTSAGTSVSLPSSNDIARDLDEQALVADMLLGKDRAWREFHARYDRLIYRCITKVTVKFASAVSAEDLREIYATLLVQLLSNDMRKLRSFDPGRGNKLGSWVGLLAINCAYDHLRALRREPVRGSITEAELVATDHPSPYEITEHRQRAGMIAAVLASFSVKDREFVALYYGEGLEAEQVAARMQISVKTVYSKKHKIHTKLAQMLEHVRAAA